MMITQEYLKSKVEYDPVTGYFTYLKSNLVATAKFRNPEEAYEAYKQSTIKYHGEFAKW